MIVRDAREIVRQWVLAEGCRVPGFLGAFYHGSVNWLPDDAILPETSDVDVMMVLDDPVPPVKPGKFIYRGVLLEVSYLPRDQVQSAEYVLGQYHLAGSFQAASVIADPSGHLATVQAAVAENYAGRSWVRKRCRHAHDKVLRNLRGIEAWEAWHDQVSAWLFAAGVTTHVLLVAGLKNPTVRTRYVAVEQLLADYGHLDFYETLLELLGCARMSRVRVARHLAALADQFDAAKVLIRTPFFFASDISDLARPIVIDGSRALIQGGHHREAVFWIVATFCRCQKIFFHEAPQEIQERHRPTYRRMLADLGISSAADLRQRGDQVRELLPRVWTVAEAIMAANPIIVG